YNAANTIKRCLNSLFEQEYPPEKYEILVVDNGSKDGTYELLQSLKIENNFLVLQEKNICNAYGARNAGAEAARGEILVFIDADCIAKNDWLKILLSGYKDEKMAVIIGDILAYRPQNIFEKYYSNEKLSLRGKD